MTVLASLLLPGLLFAAVETDRIQALIAEGKLRQALTLTDRQLQEDGASVTYRFLKGLILTRLNELDKARDQFIELTKDHPQLPEPYNNLAVIYASQGDFEKARDSLQEAISTHPSYATAHENMGDIYAKMASKAYNQALQLDSDNSSAKAKLSLVNDLFFVPNTVAEVSDTLADVTPVSNARPGQKAPQIEVKEETTLVTQVEVVVEERDLLAEQRQAEKERAAKLAESKKLKEEKSKTEVSALVDAWATAWSAKDAAKYITYYGAEFTPPKKLSRAAWEAQRKVRLAKPRFIKIKISKLGIIMLGDDHAQASFRQSYQSDTYNDEVSKKLILKKVSDKWLITQEQSE